MSGAQKFSLSLLISVVAFSGFAVLAWSGLFDYIETTFYLDRVQSSVQVRVNGITAQVEGFHRSNLDRFSAVLNQPSVRRAFDVNQARDDIVERNDYFDALQSQLPSLDYVRFVDLGGNRLHFSTREADYIDRGTSRVYTPLSVLDADEPYPVGELAYPEVDSENTDRLIGAGLPSPDIVLSPGNRQFVYRFPVLDEFGLLQGAALFYLHAGGLSTWLVRDGLVGAGDEIGLVSIGDPVSAAGGVLVNSRARWFANLEPILTENWSRLLAGERPILPADDSTSFALFSSIPDAGAVSPYVVLYLFPEADLQMTDIMKIVLLAAIFLTVFLLVFLLFNMRQDAVVVLSDRVKRFQISLLREYMENKQDLDFQRWRAELEDRRGEVATQIRRGIGRVRASQKDEVDKLIDSSWDEILEVLGSRASQAPGKGVDLDRLEDIVERVIGNLQSSGTAVTTAGKPGSLPTPVRGRSAMPVEGAAGLGEPIAVEELGDDEDGDAALIEELEDVVEVEELGDAELVEAAEAVDDPHPLGKPIEVEDITEEEFGDEELAEEVEEIEELDELDEAEPPDEIEELGGIRAGTEAGVATHPLGKPIEVEELTEEEFGDDELTEIEELGEEEPAESAPIEDLSEADLGELETIEDTEEIEESGGTEVPTESAVAGAGELFDEASELEWLAGPETPDIDGTALEEMEAESDDEVPLLEGESIAEDDDDAVGELEEIDFKLSERPGREEAVAVEDVEELDEILPADVEDLAVLGDLSEVGDVAELDDVEELDTVELEGSLEVGDLEGVRLGSTPFMAGTFSFGKGTDMNMPTGHRRVGRSDEDTIEDLETLASADPVIEEGTEGVRADTAIVGAVRGAEGPVRFTDGLAAVTPAYEIASVADILNRLHIDKNVIIDRDGVIEIGRDVYDADRGSRNDETRELVESVMGDGADDVTAGIEQLFSVEATDLFADLDPVERSKSPILEAERSIVRFVDRGFDYDGFLRGYQKTEGGIVKSLVTFTRHWGARVGVLFSPGDGELGPRYGLGLESECLQALHISNSSGIYRNVLARRLVLFVNRPLRQVEYFLGLCPDEQIAYFQKVLFLPVVIHGEEGYALLGLQERISSLDEAFGSVLPLLTSVATVS